MQSTNWSVGESSRSSFKGDILKQIAFMWLKEFIWVSEMTTDTAHPVTLLTAVCFESPSFSGIRSAVCCDVTAPDLGKHVRPRPHLYLYWTKLNMSCCIWKVSHKSCKKLSYFKISTPWGRRIRSGVKWMTNYRWSHDPGLDTVTRNAQLKYFIHGYTHSRAFSDAYFKTLSSLC